MKYIYNPKTEKLHIKGYCIHATENAVKYRDYLEFNSEDEALAYDGRAVSFCKICQKKREGNIRK